MLLVTKLELCLPRARRFPCCVGNAESATTDDHTLHPTLSCRSKVSSWCGIELAKEDFMNEVRALYCHQKVSQRAVRVIGAPFH